MITDVDSTTVNIDATSASNLTVTGGTLTVSTVTSGALDVTSAGLLDIDAASSLSINSSGGAINVGDDANTGALNLGTGAAARTVTMGNATGATALDLNSGTGGVDVGLGGDTASFTVQDDVGGNTLFSVTRTDAGSAHEVAVTSTTATFDVDAATQTYDGTDFSVDMSSDINVTTTGGCLTLESTIADVGTVDIGGDSIYFHDAGAGDLHLVTQTEYVADAATTWGLSGIYKGDSTVTTTVATGGFAAAVVATSNATIAVVAEGTFSANDLIVVTGANNPCNNGLYEVQAVNEEQLELKSLGGAAPVTDFVKDQVVTDTTIAGTVTKISVCSLRCGTDGAFEVGNFTDNTATYSDLVTSAVAVTRKHFQTTMTAVVSAGGTITSSDITDTMPTKPSSGFIFDTDAEIYLNGLLLFNGTTNEVSTGSGDDIDVESGGPTFRIGDVITIIYHTNSVAG